MMRPHRPICYLDTYRQLADYTVPEFLTAVEEEYLRQYHRPVSIPPSTYYSWLRGHRPHSDLIGPITRVLGATRMQLWRYPGEYTGAPTPVLPADLHEDAMDRRRALTVLGTAAAAAGVAAVSGDRLLDQQLAAVLAARPLTHDDLDQVEWDIELLTRGGWSVPAAALLPLVRARHAALAHWRVQRLGPPRELDRLAAKASLADAWLSFSANQLGAADSAFAVAEQAALAAGDQPLAAAVAARRSMLAREHPAYGGMRTALDHLQRAGVYVPPGGRSVVAARVATLRMGCMIRLGRRTEALAALRLIEPVLDRAVDHTTRTGLFGYGRRQLAGAQAAYEVAFGDPRRALDHAVHAARMSPPGEIVDRNLWRLQEATAHLKLGDQDGAVIVAEPVLLVPPDAWHGPLGAALRRFASTLAASRTPSARAAAFVARYRHQHPAISA